MAHTDHSVSAGSGSPAAAPAALRGRGAVTNVRHRFQQDQRTAVLDDAVSDRFVPLSFYPPVPVVSGHPGGEDACSVDAGRDDPTGPASQPPVRGPATSVTVEQARRLIARNDSPDIGFDQAVNPYRGCEHGCVYCYARPTHAYLGYSPGLDFETRLIAKANAVDALRAELARPGYKVSPINVGSATDVYQPIEREWRLTRGLLELLLETGHPLTLVTKSALVERDLDLLRQLAERNLVSVYISVTSLDSDLSRTLEPRASAPWRRLQAVRNLAQAGVPVGVLVAPVIPFINDEFLERILEAACEAGAYYGSYTVVRLPWEVKDVFEEWLLAHFPERAQRVLHRIEDMREGKRNDARFGSRMRGTGIWADLLRQRFALAVRKSGLNRRRVQLDTQQFVPPALMSGPAHSTARAPSPQLGLFD